MSALPPYLFQSTGSQRSFRMLGSVGIAGMSCTSTPEIVVNSIETPSVVGQAAAPAEQNMNNSSNCKTPYFNPATSVPDAKGVPKAPTKVRFSS